MLFLGSKKGGFGVQKGRFGGPKWSFGGPGVLDPGFGVLVLVLGSRIAIVNIEIDREVPNLGTVARS